MNSTIQMHQGSSTCIHNRNTIACRIIIHNWTGAAKQEAKLFLQNIRDSILYSIIRRRKLPKNARRIVFICKGNICRSAFAEYLLKAKKNSSALSIESCGLAAERATPSPVEAIAVARRFGLELEKHLSKDVKNCDFENADLILAMEFWQYRRLIVLFPYKKNNIGLLRGFAPFPENLLCNIDDPFGQSQEYFHECFSQIKRSVDRIVTTP